MTAAVPAAPQPPPAPTPGQAAYEAWFSALGNDAASWQRCSGRTRARWEAAVQAGILAGMAAPAAAGRPLTAPDVVAGLLADVAGSRAQLADAAPELAAAMAETRAVQEGYQELCREFSPSAQSGMSARVSLTVLNRHRVKARLPLLATTVIAATREDVTMRYRRERDEACAQLAEVRNALTLARTAAREMSDEFATWTVTPEDQERITGWRQQAGLDGDGG